MSAFIKKWWQVLFGMHRKNLLRSGLSTAGSEDPQEAAWREAHFAEAMRLNWRIFLSQWGRLFDPFYSKNDRYKREGSRIFYLLHHPTSGTRQLADWRRCGPDNPPPAVRRTLDSLRDIEIDT